MNAQIQPIAELNRRATDALVREVGIVNTLRFLNQFRVGGGDYTAERDQLFSGMSAKDIIREIKAQRRIKP
ncbi:MAG: hypothetical protein ACKN9T_13915 [Candidatus Methylumidiphilus sp.]